MLVCTLTLGMLVCTLTLGMLVCTLTLGMLVCTLTLGMLVCTLTLGMLTVGRLTGPALARSAPASAAHKAIDATIQAHHNFTLTLLSVNLIFMVASHDAK